MKCLISDARNNKNKLDAHLYESIDKDGSFSFISFYQVTRELNTIPDDIVFYFSDGDLYIEFIDADRINHKIKLLSGK